MNKTQGFGLAPRLEVDLPIGRLEDLGRLPNRLRIFGD
jgi:hypothetical protein